MSERTAPPDSLFPLIRHLSWRITPPVARLPVTPNQITTASLAVGMACNWCVMRGAYGLAVAGGGLLVLCYLLDNSDGEIARLKGLQSTFGMHFDTFVDWLVHATFFPALGWGEAAHSGNDMWLWLGAAAGAGATINYLVVLYLDRRDGVPESASAAPRTTTDDALAGKLLFALRELSRADFCFIVLALAIVDGLWLLLPFAAAGAQVYWMTAGVQQARDAHV